jgi:predicted DNA-binding transcriptional regulator YafY
MSNTTPTLTTDNLAALNAVLIQAATISGAKLRIRYVKPGTKAVRVRTLKPTSLRTSQKGDAYVRGIDDTAGEERNFRLDRMTKVVEVIANVA